MKIGVLTVHCSINAGASLQAYALCKTLKKVGYDVEIINYRPDYFTDSMDEEKLKNKKSLKERLTHTLLKGKLMKEHNAYVDFEKSFLPKATKRFSTNEDLMLNPPIYDAYLCGSDQVWNPQHTKYDGAMFLNFAPKNNRKRATYAASIGQDTLDEKDLSFIQKNLSTVDYISVREESAKKIIDGFDVEKTVTRNIDPTLLLSKPEWREIESNAYEKIKGKYILFYPLADNPITDQLLSSVKDRYGLPIIALSRKVKKIKGVDIQIRNFSPQDFIGYFDHAEYVITNSFHGCVFSMIFEKKLISYKNLTRNSRLECLFELFDTNTIQIEQIDDFIHRADKEWPVVRINQKTLENEQKSALMFLKQISEERDIRNENNRV